MYSSSDAGTGPGTSPVDVCKLAAGKYQVVYTSAGGSCSKPTTVSTVDYNGEDMFAEARSSSSCTVTKDVATCTTTSRCTQSVAGYTSKTTYSFSTKSLKGSSSSVSTPDSGSGPTTSCSLSWEWRRL